MCRLATKHGTDRFKGEVEETTLQYIIRDHDKGHFEARKEVMQKLTNELNSQYGREVITTEIKDQYYNMREKIEPVMYTIDLVEKAMINLGIKPLKSSNTEIILIKGLSQQGKSD